MRASVAPWTLPGRRKERIFGSPREVCSKADVVAKGDGTPIAGALVMVSQLEGGLRNYVAPNKTGDDGTFELVGVKPGTYFASAVVDGRKPEFMATHVRVEGDDVDARGRRMGHDARRRALSCGWARSG